MRSIATTIPYESSLLPPPLGLRPPSSHRCVQFYDNDSGLLESVGHFIGTAIASGDSAIVIATEAHREGLNANLRSRGIDPAVAIRQGRFLSLDAAETLSHFMVNGHPDPGLFRSYLGSLVSHTESAGRRERPVAVFSEMVALVWGDRMRDPALELDQLWNQLTSTHSFYLHCAYPMKLFNREADSAFIREICDKHTNVVPTEEYTSVATEQDQMQAVVLLQQKARALETEILERKKVEEASFRLAAIVESSDDAIVSKDLNGIINSWNNAAERIFGFTAQEIIGRPILVLIPPELQSEETRILAKIRNGERIEHFQTVRLTKSGERIDVSLTISPVKDRQGNIMGAAKIVRNITRQKKLEAALHTTERLASVGRLAATVAHEINNPLESVLNFVYLARQQPEISEQTKSYLTAADQEISRVAHIAQQTLGFYRDNSRPTSLDAATMVREVIAIYESRARAKSVSLEPRVEPHLSVVALQGELKQVLSNLLANAIDACAKGSKIILGCRSSFNHATGMRGVRVTVADNGCGISPHDQQKIFDPFFTTKKAVGTGLGLWITRDLLEKRGGNIRLKSSIGPAQSGTVFRFFLPDPIPAC